ncbi:Aspartate-semialdehyde dehydrogenase [uncultured archaeon]|nr:Aspartate-semialdehyde dehydrogenase [uncultured archaeon]
MDKLRVGVLGATGMVGQNYLRLLENHPWFEVAYVAASPKSAGKPYAEAVAGRWNLDKPIPEKVKGLMVEDASNIAAAKGKADFVFSALDLPTKDETKALELAYAKEGFPVFSNSSANRWTEDVPMLIPEINHGHLSLIESQKKNRGFSKGFVVVKPNCSLQSYITPIHALEQKGHKVELLVITTLQAVSGAGYPGVPSLDMVDNIVPYIGGEEIKTEKEPSKIFGKIAAGKCVPDESIKITSTCTRVPVVDGHTACVTMKFKGAKPSKEEIIKIWRDFKSAPKELKLTFAPERPIIYIEEENRPQPRKDRDSEKAMAVTCGRLRDCPVFDYRFVGLSHNTVRGAAGGGILNAELAYKKNLL